MSEGDVPPAPGAGSIPGFRDVEAAVTRIAPLVRKTPVVSLASLDAEIGLDLVFKCENLQQQGSFKIRGAVNAVRLLAEAGFAGVVATHSSGNHGAALAYAAARSGMRSTIIMPQNAIPGKKARIARSGGQIIECPVAAGAREEALARYVASERAEIVHPYNDRRVIAGQGTCLVEFLDQAGSMDVVVVPVGGGGLLSGTCIAARRLQPGLRVLAAEPELADDAFRSLKAGRLVEAGTSTTIADGLRAPVLGLTWQIMSEHVEAVVPVSEAAILEAMKIYWQHSGTWIEPSSATALAAALASRDMLRGMRVGIVLTGGNVELADLPGSARRMLLDR